jgi:hypothetical protein
MSRVLEWQDAHGPRTLHYARHASSDMLGKVLTLLQFFGRCRVPKRTFTRFSLR